MLRRVAREKKRVALGVRRLASLESASASAQSASPSAAELTAGLRAKPWSFGGNTTDFQKTRSRSTAARFDLDMATAVDRSWIPTCFLLAADMKQQGVRPTIATYNTLLRALAHDGYAAPSWAVLEDMLSVGIAPNVASFNHILHAYRTESSAYLPIVLTKMMELEVAPNSATYTLLITRFVEFKNLEMAIQCLHAMRANNLLPEGAAAQAVIILAAEIGHPRLALDLAHAFEAETVRKLEDSVWLACLRSSADNLYGEGVLECWNTLVANLSVSPDEGLCTLVTNTAARNGLPDLAADVLSVLQALEIPWQEHHLTPLVEAFCRARNFKGAFATLNIMRNSNMNPTLHSALPIVHAVEENPDICPDLWAALTQMHEENTPVDISAFNALLQASVSTQPLSRALGDYKSIKSYGLVPNAETFHIFVDACISTKNVAYAELLYQDFKDAEIHLDHDMIAKMVTLHLAQPNFINAFPILEELKAAGYVPAQYLYENLIHTLAVAGHEALDIAFEDMQLAGHTINPDFERRMRTTHQHAATGRNQVDATEEIFQKVNVPEAPKIPRVGIAGSAQRFIETGGLMTEN